jgi:hypothetical protein
MRPFIKWVAFFTFWVLFFTCLSLAVVGFIAGRNGNTELICSAVSFIFLIMSMLSNGSMWVITSPRLGRRVMHDSGDFYLEIKVERHPITASLYASVNVRYTLYRDMLLYKRVMETFYMSDPTEELLTTKLVSILTVLESEAEIKRKATENFGTSINLMSAQKNRALKLGKLIK